jgi:predicted nucleotidyltransferase
MNPVVGMRRAAQILVERGVMPLFAGIKGSTVYELPGTHTDLDVRLVYREPTVRMLGLRKPRQVIEVMEGELDMVAWELEKFLTHLLKHNGNMVELLLTPEPLRMVWGAGRPLVEIAPKFLTQALAPYYRGYAHSQFKRAQQQIRTGKGVLYTYREMYAGIWLMRTGELVFPWAELRAKVEGEGLYESTVIDAVTMDRTQVEDEIVTTARIEFDTLTAVFDDAVEKSTLPQTYDGFDIANRYLLQQRSAGWVR